MHTDNYGQQVLNETDLCNIYLSNPEQTINNALTSDYITFNDVLDLFNKPTLINYASQTVSIEQFDNKLQNNWYIPEEYKTLDTLLISLPLKGKSKYINNLNASKEKLLINEQLISLKKYNQKVINCAKDGKEVWDVLCELVSH